MEASWFVVLPPLIVIIIAACTKRILFALFMGIATGSLVVSGGSITDAISFAVGRLWRVTQISHLSSWDGFWRCTYFFGLIFFLLLSILIVIMRRSGAAYAYGAFALKKIQTMKGAETASLIMSCFFAAIDDYFTSMTLGSVMQPITDQFSIPRVKLALLISVIAAPISMILPFSSWVADLISLLRSAGVSDGYSGSIVKTDLFAFYFSSVPFMLYAIIMIIIVCYMTSKRMSYGIIARHELYAAKTGELFDGKLAIMPPQGTEATEVVKKNSKLMDFLFSIITLYVSTIALILWSGGWVFFGGTASFFSALQHGNFFFSFAGGAFCAVILSFIYFLVRKQLHYNQVVGVAIDGFLLAGSALVTLWFSWVFGSIIARDLKTGSFLAELMIGHVSVASFPLMFFILSAVIATILGRTSGTISILVPIAFEMVPAFLGLPLPIDLTQVPILSALLGAIISGSVVGKHFSPVADTTVMTSAVAGCYHLDLVKSQIQLALPSFFASLLGYYVIGITIDTYGSMPSAAIGLSVALITNLIIVHILHWLSSYRRDHFYDIARHRR